MHLRAFHVEQWHQNYFCCWYCLLFQNRLLKTAPMFPQIPLNARVFSLEEVVLWRYWRRHAAAHMTEYNCKTAVWWAAHDTRRKLNKINIQILICWREAGAHWLDSTCQGLVMQLRSYTHTRTHTHPRPCWWLPSAQCNTRDWKANVGDKSAFQTLIFYVSMFWPMNKFFTAAPTSEVHIHLFIATVNTASYWDFWDCCEFSGSVLVFNNTCRNYFLIWPNIYL